MKCEFYGCEKAAEGAISGDKSRGLKFCPEHQEECRASWLTGDPKKVVSFWVKAKGGAERATKSITDSPSFKRGIDAIIALGKVASENQRKKAGK